MSDVEINNSLSFTNKFFCEEHKLPKKYYLIDKNYFICENDNKLFTKNFSHYKEILIENRNQILKLKGETNIEIKENNNEQYDFNILQNDFKILLEKIVESTNNFFEYLKQIGKTFKDESLTYKNLEEELSQKFPNLEGILKNIKFRDASLSFMNYGTNLFDEVGTISLAYFLLEKNKESNESNMKDQILKNHKNFIYEINNFLNTITNYSSCTINKSLQIINDKFINNRNENIKYGEIITNSCEKQFYFKDDFEKLKKIYQEELYNKNLIIEDLKRKIFIVHEEKEKILNRKNKKSFQINREYLSTGFNTSKLLETKEQEFDFQEDKIFLEAKNKNEEFNNIISSKDVTLIHELDKISNFTSLEETITEVKNIYLLNEIKNKYKILKKDFENLKAELHFQKNVNQYIFSESHLKMDQLEIIKSKYEDKISAMTLEKQNQIIKISQLEKQIKSLNKKGEDVKRYYKKLLSDTNQITEVSD